MDNATKVYVATVNVPGYLPMDDEPATFETAAAAWLYLADERERGLEHAEIEGDDDTADNLATMADRCQMDGGPWDGTGAVYGDTPGYDGDHDLGLAYCVSLVERDDLDAS